MSELPLAQPEEPPPPAEKPKRAPRVPGEVATQRYIERMLAYEKEVRLLKQRAELIKICARQQKLVDRPLRAETEHGQRKSAHRRAEQQERLNEIKARMRDCGLPEDATSPGLKPSLPRKPVGVDMDYVKARLAELRAQ